MVLYRATILCGRDIPHETLARVSLPTNLARRTPQLVPHHMHDRWHKSDHVHHCMRVCLHFPVSALQLCLAASYTRRHRNMHKPCSIGVRDVCTQHCIRCHSHSAPNSKVHWLENPYLQESWVSAVSIPYHEPMLTSPQRLRLFLTRLWSHSLFHHSPYLPFRSQQLP